ncbi:MAG: F0F1 ATP synthase subunit delta, partial [Acidobacteriota bacterium]
MEKLTRKRLAAAFVHLATRQSMRKLVQPLAAELLLTNQTHSIDAVVEEIGRELLYQRKSLHADVTAARDLSPAILRSIKTTLQELTAAESVHLNVSVDPAILGGVVIRTPFMELNASLA